MKPTLKFALVALTLVAARAMAGDDIILSDSSRMEHVARSRIFTPIDVASRDTLVGPPAPKGFDPAAVVHCTFKDWTKQEFTDPDRGMNQKFRCIDNITGKKLKIRYGIDNHEVYSQVISHRLFWALGIKAQKAFRVKVVCDNCPADPYRENPSKPTPRATRNFDYATAQFSIGNHLGQNKDQGWDWTELDNVNVARGGAPRHEIEALRLLATFVYHIDSQQAQQEMICEDADVISGGCKQPWLMVADLGGTFGGKDHATNLAPWSKLPFWRDGNSKKCKPNLDDTEGYFKKVKVTKQGADFLAGLMRRLTQTQIRNLFVAAKIDEYAPYMDPKGKLSDNTRIDYTIEDWVAAFNARVSQVVNHECQD